MANVRRAVHPSREGIKKLRRKSAKNLTAPLIYSNNVPFSCFLIGSCSYTTLRKECEECRSHPPPIVSEVLTYLDVTDDGALKALLADAMQRAFEVDRSSEPGFARPPESYTRAHFAYFVELAAYAEYVCSLQGIDVDATVVIGGDAIPIHDFSLLDYDDFIDEKTLIAAALEIAIPDIEAAFPVFFVAFEADIGREVLSKFLAALGVKEVAQGLIETLETLHPTLIEQLAKAVNARRWGLVKKLLERLLNVVRSKKFYTTLASKVGETAARKAIGKIAAKFIPIFGWALLIGSFVWAIAEEV